MGILNVTPDSFSGDGLLAAGDPVEAAVAQARRMVADGADLLDIGGASSRPGHVPVDPAEEAGRVVPVIRAIAAALPGTPLSIDTTSPTVAAAALDAGAHLLNDIWGVRDDPGMVLPRRRARRPDRPHAQPGGGPLSRPRGGGRRRTCGARWTGRWTAGVPWERLIVDPGFGFGKTPDHNLALLAGLGALRALGRPVLLGTSRKSTLGKVLDLPPDQRVEATAATTALGVASGADIVRVHDVRENVRTARVADAILRGWRPAGWPDGTGT